MRRCHGQGSDISRTDTKGLHGAPEIKDNDTPMHSTPKLVNISEKTQDKGMKIPQS